MSMMCNSFLQLYLCYHVMLATHVSRICNLLFVLSHIKGLFAFRLVVPNGIANMQQNLRRKLQLGSPAPISEVHLFSR